MYNRVLVIGFMVMLAGCSDSSHKDASAPLVLTQEVSSTATLDPKIQLPAEARIPTAEAEFIKALKEVLKKGDKKGFEAMYNLEGASKQKEAMIPYIYSDNWHTYFNDVTIVIEPNNKAQRHGIAFTIPYLGDVVITVENKYGRSVSKIPVGIKKGRYYFTIGK